MCLLSPPVPVVVQAGGSPVVLWQFPIVQPLVWRCSQWMPAEGWNDDGERIEVGASDQPKIILEH